MKFGVRVFFSVLFASAFLQLAQAAEPDSNSAVQDTNEHIQSLQTELSEAKSRVAELETELSNAQIAIEQLNTKNTALAAGAAVSQDATQPEKAIDRTVRGQPLYDATNPQMPVEQEDVIAERFTPELQSQPIAITTLLEDDLVRSRIRNITRIADQVPNICNTGRQVMRPR